jgi:hypothetical protein
VIDVAGGTQDQVPQTHASSCPPKAAASACST